MSSRDQHLIYLSLGSNISPRRQYISKSLELLKAHFPRQFRCASLYFTAPYRNLVQPGYINTVLQCLCGSNPMEMLAIIGEIEGMMGRCRSSEKWDSRTIDIDILLWGSDIIRTPRLTIPHYDLSNRDFFLVPLLELNNSLVHPGTGVSLQRLLAAIPDRLKTNPERIELSD